MTATVRTLLDDVHARAWDLCSQVAEEGSGGGGDDRAAGLLAAWPSLAAATVRVLAAVPVDPAWLEDTGPVRGVLAELTPGWRPSTPDAVQPAPIPDRAVAAIAIRLGMIADLLAGEPPARTEVDRVAVVGLRANVVAVVHAVAMATLSAAEDARDTQARWWLRQVLARTERLALTPTEQRAGRYEDVAAVTSDGSLDAAIDGWARATIAVLTSRHRVTGMGLQVAAGDALILTATASTVCAAATQLGILDVDRGDRAASALAAAHEAWRPPTAWPSTVRLDGVRDPEQARASRELRRAITDGLREGRDWLSADVLADRFDVGSLVGTMRRGMHAVGNVALAQFQAVDTLVRGPGRLWIAAAAVTQPAYRNATLIEAACRRRWVPMPPGEPAGLRLLAAAKHALATSTVAISALDGTAAANPGSGGHAADALRWDRGRIVASRTLDQPALFETVRSSGLAGARTQQRAPVPLDRHADLGPRR